MTLQVALAGCGLFGAGGAHATPTARASRPPASTGSGAPATVASATYGPGEKLGALTVAHAITPVVTPLGTGLAPLRLAAVQFVTNRMGWAVGSRCAASGRQCQGVVLATRDGGATWSQRVIAPAALTGLQFLDTQNGWAFGAGVLYATTDGGVAWAPVGLPAGLGAVAGLDASFVDPADGWLTVHLRDCGGQGCGVRIYATTDAGAAWRLIASNTGSGGGATGGGTTGASSTATTASTGTSTTSTTSASSTAGNANGSGSARSASSASNGAGSAGQSPSSLAWAEYVAGGDLGGGHGWMLAQLPAGMMQVTADGGRTWSRLPLGAGGSPVGGGFASNGAGWVAATSSTGAPSARVWSSSDDGAAWRTITTIPGRVVSLAASADGASGWVTLQPAQATAGCTSGRCPEGVAVVSAIGTVTGPAPVPAGYTVTGISALDGTTAWAVGAGAGGYAILATTDGARTWHAVYRTQAAATAPAGRLWGFENGRDGWAVGSTSDPSALLRTLDGGASWAVAGTVPVADAMAAGFVDPAHGWVAGPQAAYVTADGGAAWTRLTLPKGVTVAAMGFTTQKVGWLQPLSTKTLPAPHLLVTRDGGRTWTNTGTGPFVTVAFATPALGWAIGRAANGQVPLLATTDGGAAWRAVADLGPQQWNPAAGAAPLWVGAQLAGASPDDVWLASGDHLLQSIDGGHTWVDLRGPAASGLAAAAGGYLWVRAGDAIYSVTAAGRRWTQVGWAGGA